MVSRFPIFRGAITQNAKNASKTIKAVTCLHNYLLEEMPPKAQELKNIQEDKHIFDHLLPLSNQPAQPPRGVTIGEKQRRALAEYYSGDGAVEFQWARALGGSQPADAN